MLRQIALIVRQHSDGGPLPRPAQCRRDEHAIVRLKIHLRLGIADEAREAVPDRGLGREHRSAEIELALEVIVVAGLERHLVQRAGRRALADDSDDASRVRRTVRHGRRASQHLDGFGAVGLDAKTVEADCVEARAITE